MEMPFSSWSFLPDTALLAVKWHRVGRRPFWHWVVFVREQGRDYVLDSAPALKRHLRTDLGRIKPKWFIGIIGTHRGASADLPENTLAAFAAGVAAGADRLELDVHASADGT